MSEVRAAGCDGKQAFPTRALADKVQRRRSRKGGERSKGEPYHCRHCGQFHIGTPVAQRQRRDLKRMRDRGEAALKRVFG